MELSTGPVKYKRHGGAGPFTAEVTVNNGIPLSRGIYRLFICGTTTLQDLAGNPINNGKDDVVTFTIGDTSLLPATGFAPGRQTRLPGQPAETNYATLGRIWLEIPSQGVKAPIVGVPGNARGWDTLWLRNQVGWLEGTAFPSWQGNSVLTAHVYGYEGQPGPFVNLWNLKFNEQVVIHVYGEKYTFVVRTNQRVRPQDSAYAFQSLEDNAYLTLITCQGYDAASGTYLYRRVVRLEMLK
jgi:LPXTG-site transpeptidase (sortase) family protein